MRGEGSLIVVEGEASTSGLTSSCWVIVGEAVDGVAVARALAAGSRCVSSFTGCEGAKLARVTLPLAALRAAPLPLAPERAAERRPPSGCWAAAPADSVSLASSFTMSIVTEADLLWVVKVSARATGVKYRLICHEALRIRV